MRSSEEHTCRMRALALLLALALGAAGGHRRGRRPDPRGRHHQRPPAARRGGGRRPGGGGRPRPPRPESRRPRGPPQPHGQGAARRSAGDQRARRRCLGGGGGGGREQSEGHPGRRRAGRCLARHPRAGSPHHQGGPLHGRRASRRESPLLSRSRAHAAHHRHDPRGPRAGGAPAPRDLRGQSPGLPRPRRARRWRAGSGR